MKNNKILLEEVIRMIDISEYSENKKENLKESIKKRYLKEDDDYFSFSDFENYIHGDVESDSKEAEMSDEEKAEKEKRKRYWDAYIKRQEELKKYIPSIQNDKEYLTDIDKLILAYGNVGKKDAEIYQKLINLQDGDFVKFSDLSTDAVKPEREGGRKGVEFEKPSRVLYSKLDRKEFERLADGGRLILRVGKDKITDVENFYQWMATREANLIKLRSGNKFSPEANAQLNFLARLISKQPFNDEFEQKLIEKAPTTNAYNIMSSYYNIVCKNIIGDLFQFDKNIIEEEIPTGVQSMLANLAGAQGFVGKFTKLKQTSWNNNRNVSPWFIQGVKFHVINSIKKITKYEAGNDANVQEYIKSRLDKSSTGKEVLMVISRSDKKTKNVNIVIAAENLKRDTSITDENLEGWFYHIYSDDKGLSKEDKFDIDLKNQAEHLQWKNLPKKDRELLYKSVRTAPEYLDDKQWEELQTADNINDAAEIIFNIDGGTSTEIRTLLSNALDEFIEKGGVAGITKGTHGKGEMTIREKKEYNKLQKESPDEAAEFRKKIERRRILAREVVINFMYNFLLSKIDKKWDKKYQDSEGEVRKKQIGERGLGEEAQNLKMWIKDQNKKIAKEIIKIEKSINPDLSNEDIIKNLDDLKILLKDGDKFTQSIKRALENYLEKFSTPTDGDETEEERKERERYTRIAKNLVAGERIGAGYDVEVGDEPILERKLRAKIQKILKERFTILKEEEDKLGFLSGNIDEELEVYKNALSHLFNSNTYNAEKLTNIVKEIIATGKAPKNLNIENLATHKGVYNFIITMLASVYSNLSVNEKRNVISYIFVSAFPKGENSNIMYFLISISPMSSSSRAKDMVWDAILGGNRELTSIERALNNYSPNKKNFYNFLITVIKNGIIDLYRKSKDGITDFLEDPIGTSEEGNTTTLLDKIEGDKQSYETEKNDTIKIAESLKRFMKKNLSKKEFEMFLILGDDSVMATGRTGKTKFSLTLAASALDISNVNARVTKNRLMEKLNKFIESGELREYILNETGLDISSYTNIKKYLDNKLDNLESGSEDDEKNKDEGFGDD